MSDDKPTTPVVAKSAMTDHSSEAIAAYPDHASTFDPTCSGCRFVRDSRTAFDHGRAARPAGDEDSDEHHTLDELYEYRMLYNAHSALGWLAAGIPVVKSRRHSDGELCFGGGWFIVSATLPTGQVSNHYADDFWELFDVPDVELPPAYDGHTPRVAAERLRDLLAARPVLVAEGREKLIGNLRRLVSPATDGDSIDTADAVAWIDEACAILSGLVQTSSEDKEPSNGND